MHWVVLIFPIVGRLVGASSAPQFLSGWLTIRLLIGSVLLITFHLITDISFSFDFIDWCVVAIGLFAFGYGGGSRFSDGEHGIGVTVALWLRSGTVMLYIIIVIAVVALSVTKFTGDKIGETVREENSGYYKIRHRTVDSNFTFSGTHLVNVYRKTFLIEYPVDHFNLGNYGTYGFNWYIIDDAGNMIPGNKFGYDGDTKRLILYRYDAEQYKKSQEFWNK